MKIIRFFLLMLLRLLIVNGLVVGTVLSGTVIFLVVVCAPLVSLIEWIITGRGLDCDAVIGDVFYWICDKLTCLVNIASKEKIPF